MGSIKNLFSRKPQTAFPKGALVRAWVTHYRSGLPLEGRSIGTVVKVSKQGGHTVQFRADYLSRWQPFTRVLTEAELTAEPENFVANTSSKVVGA